MSISGLKKLFHDLFSLDDTPHRIAGGAACGFFLGIIPGAGILAAILFASIFRLNRLAAIAGALSTNFWSTIVMLPAAATLGGIIFRINPQTLKDNFMDSYRTGWQGLFAESVFWDVALPLVSGFLLISAALSLAFYLLIVFLISKRRLTLK